METPIDSSAPVPASSTESTANGSSESPNGAPPPVFARLYEEEERIEGRTRWTVGGAGWACFACGARFAEGTSFHTVLRALDDATPARSVPECAALFVRRDLCGRCFAAIPAHETFASWRGVIAPSQAPPKKAIHLASLLVYFEKLGDTAGNAASGAPPAVREDGDRPPASDFVRYLLGLFLVRKRVLRWHSLDGSRLTLVVRGDEARSFVVEAPKLDAAELRAAEEEFAEIFA